MANFVSHDFYCINCGAHYPLARKRGSQRESMHRKLLYCYSCKQDCNHIEIKNQVELEEFKTNFENGVYKNECEESLDHGRRARERQEYILACL